MSVTARQIISDALIECGVCPENQAPSASVADRALRLLNRDIMDPWSAQRLFAVTKIFTTGTFAANGASRLIGPNGTGGFVIDPRPIKIISAQYVYTDSTPNINRDIRIRDHVWYANLNMPSFTSVIITDLYYSPDTPDGTAFPWPIPTSLATVQIETLSNLAQFASLDDTADFAQGYESAVCETLKQLICRAWHRPKPEGLDQSAAKARAVIQNNNAEVRRLSTDAPFAGGPSTGSDSIGFRTRDF